MPQSKPIEITLPNGSTLIYDQAVTALEVAKKLSASLGKKAILAQLNGHFYDLNRPITASAHLHILTAEDSDVLPVLRHGCAHLLAEAVQQLYPDAKLATGPATKFGFHYDFSLQHVITPEDLPRIEAKMREIAKQNQPFTREEWERKDLVKLYAERGEKYKLAVIKNIPEGEELSVYRQGKWLDMCRGPHLISTSYLAKAFKLTSVSGAYWQGDASGPSLQRVAGIAWRNKEELRAHEVQVAEAKRRDHRIVAKKMELLHFDEDNSGLAFWHPRGLTLYRTLKNYIRGKLGKDYNEVQTPNFLASELWEKTGHWAKFSENMFSFKTAEDKRFAIKPMNCPAHALIFKQGNKSYRDLPYRMSEFGCCGRSEPSGALHGLMRVRAFVQDDAHIFCTEEQIVSETSHFCNLLEDIYKDFGFTKFKINFADRPTLRAGSDATWDKAEEALRKAISATGRSYQINPGEGSFYGPKLEFILEDALGREWQCGTLQVDYVIPERLDVTYVGKDGEKHRPVLLHRAALGSLERFIGILIEHTSGFLPLWLAPVQVVVCTVNNEVDSYATQVAEKLQASGIRVMLDLRNESIGYKLREHTVARVPLAVVLGAKEVANQNLALRWTETKLEEKITVQELIQLIKKDEKKTNNSGNCCCS